MAVLRKKDIRQMSKEERKEKLNQLKQELMKEQSKFASTGIPENPGRLREIKKTIARMLTIQTAKKGEEKSA